MTCNEALILISGHLDGQNTAEESVMLQAHLENCTSCREVLNAYQEINQGLTELVAEPPRDLVSGVMEQITQQPAVKSRKRRFLFGSGTAVAAVAAVLLLLVSSGHLPNFQQGRATVSPTTASMTEDTGDAVEFPVADPSTKQQDALDAPYRADDATAEMNQASAEDGPMAMTVTTPDGAAAVMVMVITDDPDMPAAERILELQDLIAEDSITDGSVQYRTDVATAKAIADTYEEQYAITLPENISQAQDDAPCTIQILTP